MFPADGRAVRNLWRSSSGESILLRSVGRYSDTVAFLSRIDVVTASSPPRRPARRPETRARLVRSALGALVLLATMGLSAAWCARRPTSASDVAPEASFVDAVRRLGGPPHADIARLSIVGLPPKCAPSAGRVERRQCETLQEIAGRAGRTAIETGAPDALYAATLIDLWHQSPTASQVGRALSQLKLIEPLVPPDVQLLSDISAAAMRQSELTNDARPLIEAIEYADRAVALAPTYLPAAYNRTMALERFGLTIEASRSATAYLRRDSVSVWAQAIRALVTRRDAAKSSAVPTVDTDSAAIAAYALYDREAARRLGWETGLGRWSALADGGNSAEAARWLRFAENLGSTLETNGGDATLADAVRSIRAAVDPTAARHLINVHRQFAVAEQAYVARAFEAAALAYSSLLATPDLPRPVALWSRVQLGSSFISSRRADRGEHTLRELLNVAELDRYPALVGRAYGGLSTSLLRRGSDDDARAAWDSAARYFSRAGERENAAAIKVFAANGAFFRGDALGGYNAVRATLDALHDFPASFWRHIALLHLSREAVADGFPRAAVIFQDEGVLAADGSGRPLALAEALAARARLSVTVGRPDGVPDDLQRARAITSAAAAGSGQLWGEADVRHAEGVWLAAMQRSARAADAVRALDSAAAFFGAQHNIERLTPILAARVEANVAGGNMSAALKDLSGAASLVAGRASRMHNSMERATLFQSSRRVLDHIVTLRMARGELREALADIEQVRSALSPELRRLSPPSLRGPTGETAIVYQRIADTLLVWLVSGTHVHVTRQTIDGLALSQLIDRTLASLELSRPVSVIRPLLESLYEILIGPIANDLRGTDRPLVLIADGELGRVPFAALYDAKQGRYLVEDHQLRYATSLREAAVTADSPVRDQARSARVVVVGDPAVDLRENPGWTRLASARAEARAIGDLYSGSVVMVDADARSTNLRHALANASILHYAGHAVFDEARPERSYLALAGSSDSSRLAAGEITVIPLAHVRLVVLSACRTIGTRTDAVGALTGLAGAFRAAGAHGVIGSAWLIEDGVTQPLMIELHRRYASAGDGPAALRSAQLALLHDTSPALQSPAAWGAFRYLGR